MNEIDIPKGWKKVKLKEVLNEGSKDKVEDTSRYQKLTIKLNLKGMEKAKVRENMADKRPFYVRKEGEIVIGKQNYFNGSIAILPKELDGGICSNAIMSFKVKDNAVNNYIYYMLSDNNFMKRRSHLANGTGQKELSEKEFLNFDVLLPPIEEQKKIVKIFKEIDSVIKKYGNLLEEKDKLIKSQFTEMFEDKEFKEKTLDEISIISGEYGSNVSAMEYDETLPRYVRITDITENGKLDQNYLASPKNETNIEKYLLQYGDILFARTGATVGKTYLYDESDGICIYAGYCIRFRLNTKIVNPEYIFRYTQTRQYLKWVDIVKRGGAQPNINSKQYGSITIPIPPIELQNKFEEFVKQVDKQKLLLEQQKQNYENLKKGLMQKLLTGKVRVKI